MMLLSEILKNIKVGKARNSREDIITQFQDELLKGRLGTKYYPKTEKDMTNFKRSVALLLNCHPTLKDNQSLYEFLSLCKQARIPFGAAFYYNVKLK